MSTQSTEQGKPSVNPSEGSHSSGQPSGLPPNTGDESRRKEYKNVETSVNDRIYFGDEEEVAQEDKISREETSSEDENNIPKGRRKD